VQALDGVGGVDDAADLLGEGEEGITLSQALSQTARAAVRVLLSPQAWVSSSSTWRAASASAAV